MANTKKYRDLREAAYLRIKNAPNKREGEEELVRFAKIIVKVTVDEINKAKPSQWLTTKEVAKLTGYSVCHIRRNKDLFGCRKLGETQQSELRFDADVVANFTGNV